MRTRYTTLRHLNPGTRFEMIDSAGPLRGTLVKATDCRAVVDLEGKPTVVDFETINHEWIRLHRSGKRRTTITPSCRVIVLPHHGAQHERNHA